MDLNWGEGTGVYVRYINDQKFIILSNQPFLAFNIYLLTSHRLRLKVEQTTSPPWSTAKLVLEAAVLEGGWTYPSLTMPVKNIMEKSASSAIPLWETTVSCYAPMPAFGLTTSPGVEMSADSGSCSDTFLN